MLRVPADKVKVFGTTLTIKDAQGRDMAVPASLPGSDSVAASGDYGPKYFYRSAVGFSASDSNGSFTAQATYGSTSANVAWGFNLSAYLRSIATGNVTASCYNYANGSPTGYHYSKSGVSASYPFHSSIPGVQFGPSEQLSCGYTFRVNAGGNPGTANVRMVFNYSVFNY